VAAECQGSAGHALQLHLWPSAYQHDEVGDCIEQQSKNLHLALNTIAWCDQLRWPGSIEFAVQPRALIRILCYFTPHKKTAGTE
jgi:hypothetical protein